MTAIITSTANRFNTYTIDNIVAVTWGKDTLVLTVNDTNKEELSLLTYQSDDIIVNVVS